MVEFSIISLIILTMITFILDMGVSFYRYSLLTHATIRTTREYATTLHTTEGALCSDVLTALQDAALQELRKVAGNSGTVAYTAQIQSEFTQSWLQVRGVWTTPCLFCIFSKGAQEIQVTSQAVIEQADYSCLTAAP